MPSRHHRPALLLRGKGMVFSMRPYAELPDLNTTFMPLYFAMSATGGGSQSAA